LDTSLLVTALTNGTETRRMQAWLGEQEPRSLVISDWVITEFSAGLSMKLRAGQIEVSHRTDALVMFNRLSVETFTVLLVSGLQFRTAARFADHYALGLRAADALHLAICSDYGATLAHSTGLSVKLDHL
jgi:predicted nucleic acid-binding protein